MNIIANNVASKLFVAFVAAAMLFTLATPAKAATAEELQAQIAALMAQIAALQGGSSSSSAACTFTRSLTVGSEGEDVKCLQNALTPTYFNYAGGATGYFGPVTAAAVAAWQTANGVSPAVGYFGPISQAKFAATMTSDDHSDDEDTSSDDEDDMSSSDLSGEAALDTVEISDGEEADDVEEGSEDIQVAEITVNFADGDAEISRIDLALEVDSGNNGDDDPWDVFQDVSLWVDGDEVARMDASDEDEYLDEDDGSLRFSGLDIVAMEDEDVVITVAVTVNSSVDGVAASDDEDWNLAIGGIRYTDADGVTETDTDFGDIIDITSATLAAPMAEFSIEVAGAGDELELESSDEDPVATTFALDEDENQEEMVFAFDLSAEDSDGDIDLNEIILSATATVASNLDDLVNDFRIEINGDSFDAEAYVGTALTATDITFDIDGDVTIAADEIVTVMVYADFEDMETADQGSTLVMQVESIDVDAEGVEDVTVSGSSIVTSETHTLRTTGVDVEVTSISESLKENTDATTTDDEGVFVIEFDVTAFGSALYINDTVAQDLAMGTAGVNFRIFSNGSGVASSTAAGVGILDSDAELSGGYYRIGDGDTESFTLTVEYDPAATGSFKAVLYSVNFNDSQADADTQQVLSPTEDYDTDSLTI